MICAVDNCNNMCHICTKDFYIRTLIMLIEWLLTKYLFFTNPTQISLSMLTKIVILKVLLEKDTPTVSILQKWQEHVKNLLFHFR